MLAEKRLKLDGVIELKVDPGILQKRIENRIAEAKARGETLRADDDPEKLKRRVEIYHEQTAPLVDYYRLEGALKTVDGMATIPEVASAIDRALGGSKSSPKAAARRPAEKKAVPKKPAAKKAVSRAAAQGARKPAAKRGSKAARPGKAAGRGGKARSAARR
jgi:adenylate kinase